MNIGIIGCAGRMGQMLVKEISATEGCELAGGSEGQGHDAIGFDVAEVAGLGACGLAISDDPKPVFEASDVVIDFTIAAATQYHVNLAVETNTKLIIGTTGHDEDQMKAIEAAASRVAIVKAMNFSVGVNVLFALTKQLAGIMDDEFDIEIVEMHHKHKVDAPSGTALGLGEAAAAGRGVNFADVADRGRDGITGARKKGDIGFVSLRGGDVVGDHTVIFAGEGERVELTHKAASRVIFACPTPL